MKLWSILFRIKQIMSLKTFLPNSAFIIGLIIDGFAILWIPYYGKRYDMWFFNVTQF